MRGLRTKSFTTGAALILVLAGLALGWVFLSHLWFIIIVACVGAMLVAALYVAFGASSRKGRGDDQRK